LIEEQASQRDAHYAFVQEQIRQTLVGELSLPRRQRLHVRIADALAAGDRDGSVIRVAHHLHQAGPAAPAERTVDALLTAAAVDDVTALLAEVEHGAHADMELEVRLANGRTHYILSLDDPEHAWPARVAYEQAYAAAKAHGDKRTMALALLPTTWFTDYWP